MIIRSVVNSLFKFMNVSTGGPYYHRVWVVVQKKEDNHLNVISSLND